MTGKLGLTLLGQTDVRLAGEPLTGFYSGKAQALLFYLAVTGQTHTRPALAGLLWADIPEAKALMNLRQVLTNLRKLAGPYLTITRQTVAFNRDSPYWLDVEAFQASLADLPGPPDVERLRQAVELYRGDFLAGFYVRDAPLFEEWMLAQRARLRESALSALRKLAIHDTRRGDYEHGLSYTRRLLELEPWHEEAHRRLMRLLARMGQRSAALAHYEMFRQLLLEEFKIEPSAKTTALYERIHSRKVDRLLPSSIPTHPVY